MAAVGEGRAHEVVPFCGETAGLVDAVRPVSEIVESMVREASDSLRRAAALAS